MFLRHKERSRDDIASLLSKCWEILALRRNFVRHSMKKKIELHRMKFEEKAKVCGDVTEENNLDEIFQSNRFFCCDFGQYFRSMLNLDERLAELPQLSA